jgi:hypothetical protein
MQRQTCPPVILPNGVLYNVNLLHAENEFQGWLQSGYNLPLRPFGAQYTGSSLAQPGLNFSSQVFSNYL